MKRQLLIFTLALFVLCPTYSYGQNHPELDEATSFAIYKSGQNIFVEYTPFRQIMGTPDSETMEYDGMDLEYGASKFSFITGFFGTDKSHLYYAELNDTSYRVNINGVDIRVGQLADELAKYFPKSWANRVNDPIKPTSKLLNIEINETEIIFIVFNTAGIIETIGYSMRLT